MKNLYRKLFPKRETEVIKHVDAVGRHYMTEYKKRVNGTLVKHTIVQHISENLNQKIELL